VAQSFIIFGDQPSRPSAAFGFGWGPSPPPSPLPPPLPIIIMRSMCRVSACGYTMGVRSSGAAGPKEGAILHCVRFWKYGFLAKGCTNAELALHSLHFETRLKPALSSPYNYAPFCLSEFIPFTHCEWLKEGDDDDEIFSRANLISCQPQHDSTYANNLRRIFKIEHSVVYPPLVHPHLLPTHRAPARAHSAHRTLTQPQIAHYSISNNF
ncbi:hypothetical protein EVAR_100438_1, partial [Eumeta japonica]